MRGLQVVLLAEDVDRNIECADCPVHPKCVVLLAEDVDRNYSDQRAGRALKTSSSSRRTWIEILLTKQ